MEHSFDDDMRVITRALRSAAEAANAFDEMTAAMMQWNASGVYPTNKEIVTALIRAEYAPSSGRTMASRILAWARAGRVPATLHECVNKTPKGHIKGKGGRPAGKGKGKTTKPTDEGSEITLPNNDGAWALFIEKMRAQVPGRKDWAADRITAFQESCARMIALIKAK